MQQRVRKKQKRLTIAKRKWTTGTIEGGASVFLKWVL